MTRLRACILAAADAIETASQELGALDRVAGDGDHGTTMTIGARSVRRRLAEAPDIVGSDLLKQVALGMSSIGGAIGPIYGTGVLAVSRMPFGSPVAVADLRAAAEAAETAIVTLGMASPGDKTIIDALHPIVESLRASEAQGDELPAAIERAARSAREGAASTAGMIARVGRASRLGERSRGSADPGAISFAIIVEAMVRAFLVASAEEG